MLKELWTGFRFHLGSRPGSAQSIGSIQYGSWRTDISFLGMGHWTTRSYKVKLATYFPNQGPGKALRTGFQQTQGEIICTTDADLSYSEVHLIKMAEILQSHPEYDLVVGSPYITHGRTENVPSNRLLISKLGNKILSYAMKSKIATVTGVLRAYRSSCIKSLELESDGKEIWKYSVRLEEPHYFTTYGTPTISDGRVFPECYQA